MRRLIQAGVIEGKAIGIESNVIHRGSYRGSYRDCYRNLAAEAERRGIRRELDIVMQGQDRVWQDFASVTFCLRSNRACQDHQKADARTVNAFHPRSPGKRPRG